MLTPATVTLAAFTPACVFDLSRVLIELVRAAAEAGPRGRLDLGNLPPLHLRVDRFFDFRANRIEFSMDVYNATNANTIFGVRTTTGQTAIRVDGDTRNPTTLITSFLSPTQFLAPRVVRFNVTYNFNRR